MNRETSQGRATVTQLCATFRVSRAAFYAVRPLATTPPPPHLRRARPGPWASAAELDAGIRRVAAAQPGWGGRKIWASLRREGVCGSRRRVAARLRGLGLTLPAPRERAPEERRGHVVVPTSNRRLATDLTTVWTAQDGCVALVPVIDCGDRVLHAVGVTKSQEAPAILAPVVQTLRRVFGTPEAVPADLEIRSDHGPQYTGRDAEMLCAHWRLTHTFAPVGRPTGNAVAERVIQTLKVELIWTRDWASAEDLRTAIAAWLVTYNHHRPHQALGWRTPAEQRAINLAASRETAA
jgi:putative transposase